MRVTFTACPIALSALLLACSSTDHPPSNPIFDSSADDTSSAADGSTDGTVGDARDGGGKDATTDAHTDGASDGGDAGGDGSATDSTVKDSGKFDSGPDVYPSDAPTFDALGPTVCPTDFPFGVTAVAVTYPHASSGDELLAALTWDELTMAWTTGTPGSVVVHYADRATRDAAFTTDRTLPTSLGPFPLEKVALTPDGLKLYYTSADRLKVFQVSRPTRADAFDPTTATTAPFVRIMSSEASTPRPLGDLVISRDERTLIYTDFSVTSGASIMISGRSGDGTWAGPSVVDASALLMVGTARRRPSGLSIDGRTLFYFDEDDRGPKIATRALGSSDFTLFYDINPVGQRPMPAEVCDRLYISVASDLGGGVAGPMKIFHVP